MGKFNFGPASQHETIVFGSEKPGISGTLNEWIAFMKDQGIKRIVCLQESDIAPGLLEAYAEEFGEENILHAPIHDYELCDLDTLQNEFLPFLKQADVDQTPVLVHCWGGSGRTGHMLAAWLVYGRGFSPEDALEAVTRVSGVRRNPREAVLNGNASEEDLKDLLESCQP